MSRLRHLAFRRALLVLLVLLASGFAAACAFGCAGPDRAAARANVATVPETPRHAASPGEAARAILLRAIDGSPLTLAAGKVTLLVFWATWSAPDKQELIKVQELHARYGPARLSVIALSIDDEPSGLAEFATTYALHFPIAWDAAHRVAERYRIASDPTTYVIDRAGVIRFVHAGYHDGEAEVIASEIESLLR